MVSIYLISMRTELLVFCAHPVYNMLNPSDHLLMGFDRKMSNQAGSTGFFYSNAMESYLSIMVRNHGIRSIMEEK